MLQLYEGTPGHTTTTTAIATATTAATTTTTTTTSHFQGRGASANVRAQGVGRAPRVRRERFMNSGLQGFGCGGVQGFGRILRFSD